MAHAQSGFSKARSIRMIIPNLQALLSNKHTSGSAAAYAAVKIGSRIAKVWWPQHKDEIESTADLLEGFAVFYLGAAAVDASKMVKQVQDAKEEVKTAIESGDTSHLSKPET